MTFVRVWLRRSIGHLLVERESQQSGIPPGSIWTPCLTTQCTANRSPRLLARHDAATACSLVHRNSVPSTQMRCRITANRRASATIAFFIPRCLAIFIAQALSQDHLLVRVSMTWAASFAVGTAVTGRPPHRTARAEFPHAAPTLGV